MATRLYAACLPGQTAAISAPVTPISNGSWGNTGSSVNGMLVPWKFAGTGVAGQTKSISGSNQSVLFARLVSPPLRGAQTITGTFKAQFLAYENQANDNLFSRMELYVVINGGGTVRGTLLSGPTDYSTVTEWNTSLRNKKFADGDTLSSVSAQNGDRIVFCIGGAALNNFTGNIQFGNPTGTDLPEDETTTSGVPWIEFSQNLVFEYVLKDVSGNGRNLLGHGQPKWIASRLSSRRRGY